MWPPLVVQLSALCGFDLPISENNFIFISHNFDCDIAWLRNNNDGVLYLDNGRRSL